MTEKGVLGLYTPKDEQPDILPCVDRLIEWWAIHEPNLRCRSNSEILDHFQILLNAIIEETVPE